jgi:hypothetical protein
MVDARFSPIGQTVGSQMPIHLHPESFFFFEPKIGDLQASKTTLAQREYV